MNHQTYQTIDEHPVLVNVIISGYLYSYCRLPKPITHRNISKAF